MPPSRANDQGNAGAEAIAINGGTYGGYSSAMGLLRDPGLFKAGINEHAVLYVAYQSQNPPHSQGLYLRLWELYFSDINKTKNVVQMPQRFPINLVDKMQAAALIIAEKRD